MTDLQNTKLIPLSLGKFSIVDIDDYQWIVNWPYKWRCVSQKYTNYADTHCGYFNGKEVRISLHRMIMCVPDGMQVDHVNGDGLDNRRCNLRICTARQNCQNRTKNTKYSSKYKGAVWREQTKRWRCLMRINGKMTEIGTFKTELEAAKAYNEAAIKYFGEYARLNIID